MSTALSLKEMPHLDGASGDVRAGKYLIFRLGTEEFGVRVTKVREIMGMQEVTPVPQTPVAVKGVINLRGKVIPVLDLRVKFGLEPEPHTPLTCIIVVRTQMEGDEVLMGVIVDEVAEVLRLGEGDGAGEIEDTPDFGPGVDMPYLLGMAKVKDKVKILLDIDQVLRSAEIESLGSLVR